MDLASGFVQAYPMPRKTNECVWTKLRQEHFPRNGLPVCILTDQGLELNTGAMDAYLKGMGIQHRRCTPYHAQTNGKLERFQRTIKAMLSKLVNNNVSTWQDELGHTLLCYNAAVSEATGHSPTSCTLDDIPGCQCTRHTRTREC